MKLSIQLISISILAVVLGLFAAVGVAAFFVACWRNIKRKNNK